VSKNGAFDFSIMPQIAFDGLTLVGGSKGYTADSRVPYKVCSETLGIA